MAVNAAGSINPNINAAVGEGLKSKN